MFDEGDKYDALLVMKGFKIQDGCEFGNKYTMPNQLIC